MSAYYIRTALYKNKYLAKASFESMEKREEFKTIISHENLLFECFDHREKVMINKDGTILFDLKFVQNVLKKNDFPYIDLLHQKDIYHEYRKLIKSGHFYKQVSLPPELFFRQLPLFIEEFYEKDKTKKAEIKLKIFENISKEEIQLYREKFKEEKRIKKEELKKASIEKFNLNIKNVKTDEIDFIYNNKTIVTFDIEANELDNSQVIEIGISKFRSGEHLGTRHIIIEEFKDILNGRFVENNKFNFSHGNSEFMPLNKAINELTEILSNPEFIIVGLGLKNDFKFIDQKELAKTIHNENRIIDCTHFSRLYQPDNTMGVKSFLTHFKIPYKYLHNAGNDAYYTGLIFNEIHHSLQMRKQLENKFKTVNIDIEKSVDTDTPNINTSRQKKNSI